jgi:hypothetical protein
MGKLSYGYKLIGELTAFARQHKVYWIVPLVIVLVLGTLFIVASHVAAPFIYTLF